MGVHDSSTVELFNLFAKMQTEWLSVDFLQDYCVGNFASDLA
jgi:hypothetical protein